VELGVKDTPALEQEEVQSNMTGVGTG
jgi:hypothetical protein